MSLTLGSEPVCIPASSRIDLVELCIGREHFLWKDGARVLLYLEGVDAGESDRTKFTIEEGKIAKREIWSGPFPEFGVEVKTFGRDTEAIDSHFLKETY